MTDLSRFLNQVVRGDCRELLRELSPESVSLFVTSPPYGVGMEYEKGVSFAEWCELINGFAAAMFPACKPGGYAFVNFGSCTKHPVATETVFDESFRQAGWVLQARRMWLKQFAQTGCPYYTRTGPWPVAEHENLWTWFKPPAKHTCRCWKLSARSVWSTENIREVCCNEHGASYPVAIPYWAMQVYADPGDLICDPFAGSGTTLVAAHKFGSPCIGFERDPGYCEIANRRVALAMAQPALLTDAPRPAPTTGDLFAENSPA